LFLRRLNGKRVSIDGLLLRLRLWLGLGLPSRARLGDWPFDQFSFFFVFILPLLDMSNGFIELCRSGVLDQLLRLSVLLLIVLSVFSVVHWSVVLGRVVSSLSHSLLPLSLLTSSSHSFDGVHLRSMVDLVLLDC